MKQKFSTSWKGSRQKRKQRKYLANAPLHIRHKLMSVNLSKVLREKHRKRSLPVRKGDNVKVMRGKFKGKNGKISKVNLVKLKVSVEGLQTQKKDGTKVEVYFKPSNLQIQELSLEDKKRLPLQKQPKETDVKKKENKQDNKNVLKKE